MDIINFSKIAAPKFEFGCGFYFCVIGALKYIIGIYFIGSDIGERINIFHNSHILNFSGVKILIIVQFSAITS